MSEIARSAGQLGAVIREARRAKGFTQMQLGELTGLRQATISKIEKGEDTTRIGTITNVLAALDLELTVRIRTKFDLNFVDKIF